MSQEKKTIQNDSKKESYGLKNQVLSHAEVLGQSIANIAPTGTPTVVVPLVFAAALSGTWFAYLFALIGILLVSVSTQIGIARFDLYLHL
jgi:hypothetical protein